MGLCPGPAGCCACDVTFCVYNCGVAESGATVTVKSGSTTIASGTTSSEGCVSLNIGSAGTYTVTATKSSLNYSGTRTLACDGEYYIDFTGLTPICVTSWCGQAYTCGAAVEVKNGSTVLFSGTTDDTGCISFPLQSTTYTVVVTSVFPTYSEEFGVTCGDSVSLSLIPQGADDFSGTITDNQGTWDLCFSESLLIATCYQAQGIANSCDGEHVCITYIVECDPDTAGNWRIYRLWFQQSGEGPPCYEGGVEGQCTDLADYCEVGTICNALNNNSVYGSFTPNACDPTGAVSGSLTLSDPTGCPAGTTLTDPIGGTVALSFVLT
jgi:hypothetical protein